MEWFLSLPNGFQLLFAYFIVITVVTFFAFGLDKMKSVSASPVRRTSEKALWFLSAIGGSVGALLGMHFFRHKTKKVSFQAGIIVIVALQICLVVFFLSSRAE